MPIYVDGRTAAMIERGISVLEAKQAGETAQRTRRVPMWLPSGEEVKTLAQASVMMGLPEDVVARYAVEQKDIGEDLAIEATAFLQRKAFFSELEVKAVRHVRDAAYWKMPVGTIIVGGKNKTPLKNLRYSESPYDGASAVTDKRGKTFYVAKDPETGHWVASVAGKDGSFQWDNLAVDGAKSEDEAYRLLDSAVTGDHHLKNKAPLKPGQRVTQVGRMSYTEDGRPKYTIGDRSITRQKWESSKSWNQRLMKFQADSRKRDERQKRIDANKKKDEAQRAQIDANAKKRAASQQAEREGIAYRAANRDPKKVREDAAKRAAAKRAEARGGRAPMTSKPGEPPGSTGFKRPSWYPKKPSKLQEMIAKYFDRISGDNPDIWDGGNRHSRASIQRAQHMDKEDQKRFDMLSPRQQEAVAESVGEGNYPSDAITEARWNELSGPEERSVRNLDTQVRDWYWGARDEGSNHADALDAAKAFDRMSGDWTRKQWNDFKKLKDQVGLVEAVRQSGGGSRVNEPFAKYSDRDIRDGLRGIRDNINRMKRDKRPVPAAMQKMLDEYMAEARKRGL